jgi:hypothetical protein
LTKEKFSLQRTLEKSQELAETLATDNSALTDKFNQQVCASFADIREKKSFPDDITRILGSLSWCHDGIFVYGS